MSKTITEEIALQQITLILFLFTIPFHLLAQIVEYHPEVDSLNTETTAEPYYHWTVTNSGSLDSLSLQVFETQDHNYPASLTSPQADGVFENFYLIIDVSQNGETEYQIEYSIQSAEGEYQNIPSDSFFGIDHIGIVYFKFVVLNESERVDSVMIIIDQQFGLSAEKNELPPKFNLSQNYPNPFNPSTVISFELFKPRQVSLIVYDLLGREASRLINHELYPAGIHQKRWEPSGELSSGIYLYQLISGEFQRTRKMMLIK